MCRFGVFMVVILLVAGCSGLKKKKIEQVDEAAVVSIYANKRLDVSNFQELEGLANQLAQDPALQLDTVVHLLRRKTITNFAGKLPFPLANESDVLARQAYQEYELPPFNSFYASTSSGYKAIPFYRKDVALSMFDILPDRIQAIMIVGMDYRLMPAGKVMTFVGARVQSKVDIRVWNEKGTSIMKANRKGVSDDTLKFPLGGVFQAREVRPLCIDASLEAIGKMEQYLKEEL